MGSDYTVYERNLFAAFVNDQGLFSWSQLRQNQAADVENFKNFHSSTILAKEQAKQLIDGEQKDGSMRYSRITLVSDSNSKRYLYISRSLDYNVLIYTDNKQIWKVFVQLYGGIYRLTESFIIPTNSIYDPSKYSKGNDAYNFFKIKKGGTKKPKPVAKPKKPKPGAKPKKISTKPCRAK